MFRVPPSRRAATEKGRVRGRASRESPLGVDLDTVSRPFLPFFLLPDPGGLSPVVT